MENFAAYSTIAEIEDVVDRFERCRFAKQEFTHAHHLAVAAWYLHDSTPEEALTRMRSSLLRFTSFHGVNAYHETITRFWLLLTHKFLNEAARDLSFPEAVTELVRRYGRKDILFAYYSQERIQSAEAKKSWLDPDLQELR